jgi:hypothetical protein
MNPIGFVKSHPVMTGVGVVGIIGLVFLLSSSGGGDGSVDNSSTSDVAAGTALQQYQLQAQAQQSAIGAQRDVALAEQSTALKIAELSASTRVQELNAQKEIGLAGIDAGKYTSALQAQLSRESINADKAKDANTTATLMAQIKSSQQTTMAALNAQTQQAQIAAKPKGLFSWLFG